MTQIIGLNGKAEHGKTASARIIKEYVEGNGGTAAVFEISRLIYDHCVQLRLLPAGLAREDLTFAQLRILVEEGSRMRNTVDPNYWTDMIVKQMLESGVDIAICPNVRFPQEAQAIRDVGGVVVRINRLNKDGSPYVSPSRDPNHETETALDRWPADYYVYNLTGHNALLEKFITTLYEYIELKWRLSFKEVRWWQTQIQ
jgi:hypothetical protein